MTPRRAARIRAGIQAAQSPQPWTRTQAAWPRVTWDAYHRTITRRITRPRKEDQ